MVLPSNNSILTTIIDQIDQCIALCDVNSMHVIESNAVFDLWLGTILPKSINELFNESEINKFNKTINKNRKIRFNKTIEIKGRQQVIEFNSTMVVIKDVEYLLIQGKVLDNELERQTMVQNYSQIIEKNRILLIESKEKAENSDKKKGMFLGIISHEIRTPLNAILGVAQQLTKLDIDNLHKNQLSIINSSSKQLLSIIDNILYFSNLSDGKVKLENKKSNINKLILDVIKLNQLSIKSQQSLSCSFNKQTTPNVYVDDIKLYKILNNLISNAIKFSDVGEINIDCELVKIEDNNCCFNIIVSDEGIGIDENDVAHLFNAFQQKEEYATRSYAGIGLGLSICQSLVDLLDGQMQVKSTLGKGASFSLSFCFEICEHEIEDIDIDVQQTNQSLQGSKILIVEDTFLNQEILKMALEETGAIITVVDNGLKAVECYQTQAFDIVLMDCLMPVMDGFTATKKIRQLQLNKKSIPIIAVTASTGVDIQERCKKCGMDDIILKPFEFEHLIKTVSYWVYKSN
ncbi:MAG: response regulator [Saccharospirillaceae bacterium]|nr:response regulator [Pseudomonadales bacterium]NRB80203.1 response regulator [Saccharospirillaceae bacterium]